MAGRDLKGFIGGCFAAAFLSEVLSGLISAGHVDTDKQSMSEVRSWRGVGSRDVMV